MSVDRFGMQKLPAPGEYRAIVHSMYVDIQRADTLQRLYFPSVQRYYDASVDTLIPLLEWLENQIALQEADSMRWHEQFSTENAEKCPR